jgi:hypothetical protein
MFSFLRAHRGRVLGVAAAGVVVAGMSTGVTLAVTSTGYAACANSGHKLALENSAGNCPSNFSKVTVGAQGPKGPRGPAGLTGATGAPGATGAQGPSGVVSMTQYSPGGATPVTGGTFAFLGSPPQEAFTNADTAAEVTGTVDEASSTGSLIDEFLGICYEPVGGSTVSLVSYVEPEFAAAAGSFFAQTVSGAVGSLGGEYYVGLCAADQTNVRNGVASVTITMAQTSSGVTYDGARAARAEPAKSTQ